MHFKRRLIKTLLHQIDAPLTLCTGTGGWWVGFKDDLLDASYQSVLWTVSEVTACHKLIMKLEAHRINNATFDTKIADNENFSCVLPGFRVKQPAVDSGHIEESTSWLSVQIIYGNGCHKIGDVHYFKRGWEIFMTLSLDDKMEFPPPEAIYSEPPTSSLNSIWRIRGIIILKVCNYVERQ